MPVWPEMNEIEVNWDELPRSQRLRHAGAHGHVMRFYRKYSGKQ